MDGGKKRQDNISKSPQVFLLECFPVSFCLKTINMHILCICSEDETNEKQFFGLHIPFCCYTVRCDKKCQIAWKTSLIMLFCIVRLLYWQSDNAFYLRMIFKIFFNFQFSTFNKNSDFDKFQFNSCQSYDYENSSLFT